MCFLSNLDVYVYVGQQVVPRETVDVDMITHLEHLSPCLQAPIFK